MLEIVSHYVMPGESETETTELIHSLGLDGIENLIYGTTPSPSPFTRLTVGAHLKFWPTWMDFYLGNEKRIQKQYTDKQSLIACYGANTPEKWIEEIKKKYPCCAGRRTVLPCMARGGLPCGRNVDKEISLHLKRSTHLYG